jgi:hypothetical protein
MTKITRHYAKKKKVDDAKLRRLWPSRLSDKELVKQLGHHTWTLRRRAIKLGLPSSRRELWGKPTMTALQPAPTIEEIERIISRTQTIRERWKGDPGYQRVLDIELHALRRLLEDQ